MFKKRKFDKTTSRKATSLEQSLKPAESSKITKPPVPSAPASTTRAPQAQKLNQARASVVAVGADLPEAAALERPGSPELEEVDTTPQKRDRFAPIRTRKTIKSSVATDYQFNICKEYQQRGYCGFGDNCKFLHVREEFVSSAKMDLDAKKTQEKPESDGAEQLDVDQCIICNKTLVDPVAPACKHAACETCFLKRTKDSTICVKCGKETNGTALAVI